MSIPGIRRAALVISLMCLVESRAGASLIMFTGEDLVSSLADPRPNSAAAASSFLAAAQAIGTPGLIDFESASVGGFSSLAVAPGVTLTGSDINGSNQAISNAPNADLPTLFGSNTTPGGAGYVYMNGGTITFTFAQPIQFFGAYFTGIQSFVVDTITFDDGASQVIQIPQAGTSPSQGAVDFVGFTDAGKSITSVTIFAGNGGFDAIGVDDVVFQAAVPEPCSLLLCGIAGLTGLCVSWRRRRAAVA